MTAKVTIMMMRVRMTVLKRKEESADGDDDDDDDGGGEMMMTTTEMVETMQCLQCKSVTVDGGHSNRNRLWWLDRVVNIHRSCSFHGQPRCHHPTLSIGGSSVDIIVIVIVRGDRLAWGFNADNIVVVRVLVQAVPCAEKMRSMWEW
jgi:hypothetical protein